VLDGRLLRETGVVVPARARALAAVLALAVTATLAFGSLALTGCSSTPAAPVESVTSLDGGKSAASVTYDGLTLTLTAPASAVASAPVAVTVTLQNKSGQPIQLDGALVGVRGFPESASAETTAAAFEAGLDEATLPPVFSLPAGGSKTVPLTFAAPAQGIYKVRGVFGSSMRVKGNATPALTLRVR
jgi:hypothetical protein